MKVLIESSELERLQKCERVCQATLQWALREAAACNPIKWAQEVAACNPNACKKPGDDPAFDALLDTASFMRAALSKTTP